MNCSRKNWLAFGVAAMISMVAAQTSARSDSAARVSGVGAVGSDSLLQDDDIDALIKTGLFETHAPSASENPTAKGVITPLSIQMIPHDQVKTIWVNQWGNYQATFKPSLYVSGGCVPFPAVNWAGQLNGGLESTGSENGGCSSSTGQVYSRSMYYKREDNQQTLCATMYAWYFPKDGNWWAGHRHDWEAAVVWTTSCTSEAKVLAVSVSGHGQYDKYYASELTFDGKQVRIRYANTGVRNYQLFRGRSYERGGFQPLVSWWQLPSAARNSLEYGDFGKAIVPMQESKFYCEVRKARFWSSDQNCG